MKNIQIPPAVMFGISAFIIVVAAVVLWLTTFREPPATDPRTINPQDILDPDPPRTRDMQPGRGNN